MSVDGGLRQIFRERLSAFDFVTVEMGVSGTGAPDMNYCYDGTEGWIEAKACDHWRIKVRPEQVGWVERRLAHGGRVYVAVRRARRELWLFHGVAIRLLKDARLDAVPSLGTWTGGPSSWDWAVIATFLTGKA